MVNKKFVSKVDEKLKAAEMRRAELERAKAEEMQKKIAMRRDRMKKVEVDENKKSSGNGESVAVTKKRDIKEFEYMQLVNGKLIKLNWEKKRERNSESKCLKLFNIKCVENLIEKEEFGLAEVVLGILKRSIEARHPIQNKFAHLHGRITEIKEKNKRAFTHENALNFTGSISPIRVPEFEADLGQLSRISSPPAGMEELEKKYCNIEELAMSVSEQLDDDDDENDEDNSIITGGFTGGFAAGGDIPVSVKTATQSPAKSPTRENNFLTVISPMKRPHKEIEAEVVYTPQRKSSRRALNEEEIIYADEKVSQILLNDPDAAFISNPYITMRKKSEDKKEDS